MQARTSSVLLAWHRCSYIFNLCSLALDPCPIVVLAGDNVLVWSRSQLLGPKLGGHFESSLYHQQWMLRGLGPYRKRLKPSLLSFLSTGVSFQTSGGWILQLYESGAFIECVHIRFYR